MKLSTYLYYIIKNKNTEMKKAILASVVIIALISCNNTPVVSTAVDTVRVDSCKAVCDSTVRVDTIEVK